MEDRVANYMRETPRQRGRLINVEQPERVREARRQREMQQQQQQQRGDTDDEAIIGGVFTEDNSQLLNVRKIKNVARQRIAEYEKDLERITNKMRELNYSEDKIQRLLRKIKLDEWKNFLNTNIDENDTDELYWYSGRWITFFRHAEQLLDNAEKVLGLDDMTGSGFKYRKLPKQNLYKVYNKDTGEVYSKGSTLENAKAQIRLLYMKEKEKMKGKGAGSSVPRENQVEKLKRRLNEIDVELLKLNDDLSYGRIGFNIYETKQKKLIDERINVINNLETLNEMNGNGIKEDFQKVGRTIKKGFERKVIKPVNKIAGDVKEYAEAVIYGRNDYPPKVRDILKKYGNETISKLTIMRTPVPKVLTGALSFFSLGKFGRRLERSFDELFHLFLEITTTSGKRLSLEKNEVINMDINPSKRDKTETKNVINVPQQLTINDMLNNTKKYMGNNFFRYSAKSNNCQDFLASVFKANNIGDSEDIKFIKQNTKQLFEGLPYLRKLANTITDLGASVNVLTTGKGINKKEKNIISNNSIMSCCELCGKELDGMEGEGINIGRAFRKLGKDIKKGFKKEIERPVSKIVSKAKKINPKDVAKDVKTYVTKRKGGLASDLVKYGIPSVTAGLAGAAGSMVGPVSGVAASAVGKKLGDMAASEVAKKTGTGMRKGRFVKGSPEAIAWGKAMRERRGRK